MLAAQARALGRPTSRGRGEFEDKDLSTIRKTTRAGCAEQGANPAFHRDGRGRHGAAQDLADSLNAIDPNAEKLSVNHILSRRWPCG